MKKVLVFPCGSEIGLEIHRSLCNSIHFELYGASSIDNHGMYVYKNYIGGVPNIDAYDCIARINEIIDRYNIDFLFPAHDSAVLKFARNREQIHCKVITSDASTCDICRSKLKTYNVLKDVVATPRIYNESDELQFPLFAKPDIGQGSRGAHIINNREEYEFFVKNREGMLLSEYLPGPEYTIDCFTDRHRNLLFCRGRRRARISNGISVNAIPANHAEFQKFAEIINRKLKLRGMWFFQLKERASGEFVLMEMAPRIAGTMGLFRGKGVNFAQLSLFDAMDVDVSIIENSFAIESDRALTTCFKTDISYDTVYIDFDDTIVCHGMVNTDIIKFIYQAKNEQKRIILLSRHASDIHQSLQKYCIDPMLFEDVIVIDDRKTPKSGYIKTKSAIFIDDSFAERIEVLHKCHIPVFSVNDVDVLINNKA